MNTNPSNKVVILAQNTKEERAFLGDYNFSTRKWEGGMSFEQFEQSFPECVKIISQGEFPRWGSAFYSQDKKLIAQNWDTSD
jgi:hypothetical protein